MIVKLRENVEVREDDLDRDIAPRMPSGFSPKPFEKQCQQIISMVLPIVQTSVITLLFIFSLQMKKEVKAFQNLGAVCPVCTRQFWRCRHWKFMEHVIHPGLRRLCHFLFLCITKNQYQTLGHLIVFLPLLSPSLDFCCTGLSSC